MRTSPTANSAVAVPNSSAWTRNGNGTGRPFTCWCRWPNAATSSPTTTTPANAAAMTAPRLSERFLSTAEHQLREVGHGRRDVGDRRVDRDRRAELLEGQHEADDGRVAPHRLVEPHQHAAGPALIIEPDLGIAVDVRLEAAPLEDQLGGAPVLVRHSLHGFGPV